MGEKSKNVLSEQAQNQLKILANANKENPGAITQEVVDAFISGAVFLEITDQDIEIAKGLVEKPKL